MWIAEPDSVRRTLCWALLLVGAWQLAGAFWIDAKALLAQRLIAQAWENTLEQGSPVRPWPWADTWPVARLRIPRLQQELYVLAGASGNALAFGPGHELASAELGEAGLSVIGGHRDTHFDFLRDMRTNTLLSLQLPDRRQISYRVTGSRVVDSRREPIPVAQGGSELLLVTCYPFDAINAGGPLRFAVRARRLPPVAPSVALQPFTTML